MYKFSKESLRNLEGVHPDLVILCHTLLNYHDFKVISGVRTAEEQEKLVAEGKSKTLNSKHLVQEDGYGHAVDLLPYVNGRAVSWEDSKQFYTFGGMLTGIAAERKNYCDKCADVHFSAIRWGGDWDGDNDLNDQTFNDLVHFEIKS